MIFRQFANKTHRARPANKHSRHLSEMPTRCQSLTASPDFDIEFPINLQTIKSIMATNHTMMDSTGTRFFTAFYYPFCPARRTRLPSLEASPAFPIFLKPVYPAGLTGRSKSSASKSDRHIQLSIFLGRMNLHHHNIRIAHSSIIYCVLLTHQWAVLIHKKSFSHNSLPIPFYRPFISDTVQNCLICFISFSILPYKHAIVKLKNVNF